MHRPPLKPKQTDGIKVAYPSEINFPRLAGVASVFVSLSHNNDLNQIYSELLGSHKEEVPKGKPLKKCFWTPDSHEPIYIPTYNNPN